MNAQSIKEFQTAIAKTHWRLDFEEFCKRTGFVGGYAEQKWWEWRKLNEILSKYDAETLAKIVA